MSVIKKRVILTSVANFLNRGVSAPGNRDRNRRYPLPAAGTRASVIRSRQPRIGDGVEAALQGGGGTKFLPVLMYVLMYVLCIKDQQNARIVHDSWPKNWHNTRFFYICPKIFFTKFQNFTSFARKKYPNFT